jgi:hypothetical protein
MVYKETRFEFEEIIPFESKTDRFLEALAKMGNATVSFIPSVGPRATTRFLLDGFS